MSNKTFTELVEGYVQDRLTDEELSYFFQLLKEKEHQHGLQQAIEQFLLDRSLEAPKNQKRADVIFQNIIDRANKEQQVAAPQVEDALKIRMFSVGRLAIAASLVGLVVISAYFWINKRNEQTVVQQSEIKATKPDILPGTNKAMLTLADGSIIYLDEAKDGNLAQQGAANVVKNAGQLSYKVAPSANTEVVFNTVSTPRGGQYQIVLPDGTAVWLNAASSLRFPTAFTGSKREVEIKGEAYFEVAKNKELPFVVHVNGSEVKVFGTHFNIMAYEEEGTLKTTLLEGSVQFSKGAHSSMLKPGEQAVLSKNDQLRVVNGVDLEQVVAWKNGMFLFDNADLETVMRQIARWYDVEVVYQNKNREQVFVGETARSANLSEVLQVLELAGSIHFKIEGRKLIVL